jgi:alkanesulfonate monooxygenase SsuD/methylene tetrahydromethanopterin reductase-like flavin-dependent oxidoreductase (luciferase family)
MTSAPVATSQGPITSTDDTSTTSPGASTRQFGIMLYPDVPFPTLIEQARWVESLGFDQIYLPDHSANLQDLDGPWFDGLTALAVVAAHTESIRVGTLVSNPILRSPAMLARQALSIDHLSGGRLELGIGAGVFDWDHRAVGSEPWSAKERAGRFAEYVEIVDGILRGAGEPYSFEGSWLWAPDVRTAPTSVQRPRPPIIVGGQSPTVLRTAARFADVWNTIGPMGADAETVLEVTARQTRQIDELAAEAGRDPATIERSFALYGPWDPWEAPVTLEEVVERFDAIGITGFVTNIPDETRLDEFERMARETVPALRARQD